MYKAVFPDSEQEFKVWELHGQPLETRYISVSQLKSNQVPSQLPESDKVVSDSIIESGDSFAVELKVDGEWVVSETDTTVDTAPSSQQTQPADNSPKPLFRSGSDFFSNLQAKKPQVVKPVETKDSKSLAKPSPVLPGTLGLGNM